MTTSLRAFASATNTSAGSAFTTQLNLPTSGPGGTVAIGDVVLIAAVSERVEIPTLSYGGSSAGINTLATGNTNLSYVLAWRRILSSSDLGAQVQMANVNGRRQTLGVTVIAGAADPTVSVGAITTSAASTTATTPSITPAAADAFLVSVLSYAPYQGVLFGRTSTVAAPYTERVDAMGAYSGGANPGVAMATQQLAGGSGVAQAGATFTSSDATFFWYGSTVSFLPATTSTPPTLSITDKGAFYVIEATGSAAAAGALTYSISQVSGTATTITALGTQRWGVVQGAGPVVVEVLVTEAGNPLPARQQFTVPAAAAKGLALRRRLTVDGWQ